MIWHILIVEDEEWARSTLQDMLLQVYPVGQLSFTCVGTIKDAVSYLTAHRADLIFMDIHLADGNSFGIFERVNVTAPVIFTTAYEQYALEAFRNQGYAYLLKPYDLEDLMEALERVKSMLPQDTKVFKNRFLVKYGIHLKSLATADIAYFMADDKVLYAIEKNGSSYIIEDTLAHIIDRLDPAVYFQISRKFIVRVESIVSMLKISRGRIKLELDPAVDTEVIVSQDRSVDFQLWLDR